MFCVQASYDPQREISGAWRRNATARFHQNSQVVDVNFRADVNVGNSWHDRHRVLVIPAAEVLVLQAFAVVLPAIEVLSGSPVEQPMWQAIRGKQTPHTWN